MKPVTVLQRRWKDDLATLVRNVKHDLLVSSPYITRVGVDCITDNLSPKVRSTGQIRILTDLSPENICFGSTEPFALLKISEDFQNTRVFHLPRLHAKVYVADHRCAIVTSANLTSGGMNLNLECGVLLAQKSLVSAVRDHITGYSELGALVSTERLKDYCRISETLRKAYRRERKNVAKSVKQEFRAALRVAEDDLIRARLAEGPMHSVFSKTLLYLLKLHGPLSTKELHPMIQTIHHDLCDDSVDRVIDGNRFGKKWKHAVRTAQQHLKKQDSIALLEGRWKLIK